MPDKIIEIADAIKSINPNADFSYAEYNTDEETIANITKTVNWNREYRGF